MYYEFKNNINTVMDTKVAEITVHTIDEEIKCEVWFPGTKIMYSEYIITLLEVCKLHP